MANRQSSSPMELLLLASMRRENMIGRLVAMHSGGRRGFLRYSLDGLGVTLAEFVDEKNRQAILRLRRLMNMSARYVGEQSLLDYWINESKPRREVRRETYRHAVREASNLRKLASPSLSLYENWSSNS